ncbi:MAG: 1-deoxy-D-xylulose-5-phosphate synthase, partial [Gemmatimonadetes bacterium]|nr:1-deoxy-D-xylulose-5-phosphate synthase [Gemmatimonadota bacterium]
RRGQGLAVLATGTMVLPALEAAKQLETHGIDATVVNCRFLKPFDRKTLRWVIERHGAVLTVEEGTVVNGFGAAIARMLESDEQLEHRPIVEVMGVPDTLIEHANRAEQLQRTGLTPEGIAHRGRALADRGRIRVAREIA